MLEGHTAIEVFCIYVHEDEKWLHKLEKHLHQLEQQGLVSLWYERLILPGTDRAEAIDKHLESASIILLLVSVDSLASDYCYGIEMKRAMQRHDDGQALVIPILVRFVDWKSVPFARLQPLPTNAQPLATWEDEDRALMDVAVGLREAIKGLSLLAASASRAALPARWNIPYPRNPFFLGRDDELVQMRRQLQATAPGKGLAISGLGGIGKTQLAVEYAYRFAQDYQAVFWANAESTEALFSSYVAIANLLQLSEREAKEQEKTFQAVKGWLQSHQGWLLILDNADELALLQDFLPPSLGGHVLLTTRATAVGKLAQRLGIATLDPEQGALFLLRRAGLLAPDAALAQASLQDRELALQITQELLEGLPLALDQTGAYLEETGCGLSDYLQIYQHHRPELLNEQRRGLVTDHPEPVATTWSLSFRKVAEKNPAAAELLRLCAFLAPDAIPEEILTQGASFLGPVLEPVVADPFLLNQAVWALLTYSLVQRDPREKTFSMHRLVQAVLQDAMEEAQRRTWAERAMLAVNASFPHGEYGTWLQCERLLPQVLACAATLDPGERSVELTSLLAKTADYLCKRARYAQAQPLYQRALDVREQALGPAHPEVASSLEDLAELYRRQGKYAQAEPLYLRALAINKQTLGPAHPEVASSLKYLANFYRTKGEYAQAEPLYLQALNICKQALGPAHPEVASSLECLADIYRTKGEYAQAEPLYLQALNIREQALGPAHPEVASSLECLADIYRRQGKYAQAEPLYLRALDIKKQTLGPAHPDLTFALSHLADLYQEQGKYTEAEPLYRRVLNDNYNGPSPK